MTHNHKCAKCNKGVINDTICDACAIESDNNKLLKDLYLNCGFCGRQHLCHPWLIIALERKHQDEKHPKDDHSDEVWLTILMEEVGELASEMHDVRFHNKPTVDLLNELIQVAAVAQRWLEQKMKEADRCKFFKGVKSEPDQTIKDIPEEE